MNAGTTPFVLSGVSVRPARMQLTTVLRGFWRSRWGILRLSIAASLLVVFASDNQSRLARLQYAGLADLDHFAYARELRDAGQYDDALAVIDAAIQGSEGGSSAGGWLWGNAATPERKSELTAERATIIAERDSYWRKAKAVGVGALIGTGDSLESLAGAVAADLLVVGDMRDLAIQSGRLALDGECDKLVVILSGIGLATTLEPGDVAPAFLKAAYKAGCLTRRMTDSLVELARAAMRGASPAGAAARVGGGVVTLGRTGADAAKRLAQVAQDLRDLVKGTSAPTAARALRSIEHPAELAALAAFARRNKSAGFVLHVTGDDGVRLIRRAAAGTTAGADEALILAARKGPRGVAWLRSGAARLMRPHPLLGLAKGWTKGNVQHALSTFSTRYLDPGGWLVIPALAAWALVEAALIIQRFVRAPARATPSIAT